MSWCRLDDGYDTHPKLLELTEQQRWRWTRVLLHCSRHQTQGHVKTAVLRELGLARTTQKLLSLGLLEQNGEAGYLVHDWAMFNPKDPTKAERQARWRSKQPSTQPSTSPSTSASTEPSTSNAPVDADVDTEIVYSRAGTRARPVPSLKPNPVTATQHAPEEPGNGGGQLAELQHQATPEDIPW